MSYELTGTTGQSFPDDAGVGQWRMEMCADLPGTWRSFAGGACDR